VLKGGVKSLKSDYQVEETIDTPCDIKFCILHPLQLQKSAKKIFHTKPHGSENNPCVKKIKNSDKQSDKHKHRSPPTSPAVIVSRCEPRFSLPSRKALRGLRSCREQSTDARHRRKAQHYEHEATLLKKSAATRLDTTWHQSHPKKMVRLKDQAFNKGDLKRMEDGRSARSEVAESSTLKANSNPLPNPSSRYVSNPSSIKSILLFRNIKYSSSYTKDTKDTKDTQHSSNAIIASLCNLLTKTQNFRDIISLSLSNYLSFTKPFPQTHKSNRIKDLIFTINNLTAHKIPNLNYSRHRFNRFDERRQKPHLCNTDMLSLAHAPLSCLQNLPQAIITFVKPEICSLFAHTTNNAFLTFTSKKPQNLKSINILLTYSLTYILIHSHLLILTYTQFSLILTYSLLTYSHYLFTLTHSHILLTYSLTYILIHSHLLILPYTQFSLILTYSLLTYSHYLFTLTHSLDCRNYLLTYSNYNSFSANNCIIIQENYFKSNKISFSVISASTQHSRRHKDYG
jgi:hypothetical protein